MVLVKEFRIPMPLTVEEYEVGQLFAVAEVSKEETKGDSGVEILKNEPYDNEMGKGQYTYKIYHLGSQLPRFITMLMPASALTLIEEAWNGYPNCKTVLTNPFLGERFHLTIMSKHFADAGIQDNVHELQGDQLKHREVDLIDIAYDEIPEKEYELAHDPAKFHSEKTNRGPLLPDWKKTQQPIMTCYKVVIMKFKVLGLESKVESFVSKFQRNLFQRFHRKVFTLIDKWSGLTIQDIRDIEAKAKEELDAKKAERDRLQAEAEAAKHHKHK